MNLYEIITDVDQTALAVEIGIRLAAGAVLVVVAMVACVVPAGRATRVDPMTALRHE